MLVDLQQDVTVTSILHTWWDVFAYFRVHIADIDRV